MQSISQFSFSPAQETSYTSKRQEIVADILSTINKSREGTEYKPATFQQINGMLRNVKGWDLDIFYRAFKDAKNPSAFFFWKIKDIKQKISTTKTE